MTSQTRLLNCSVTHRISGRRQFRSWAVGVNGTTSGRAPAWSPGRDQTARINISDWTEPELPNRPNVACSPAAVEQPEVVAP
jgi:hypothetical protein